MKADQNSQPEKMSKWRKWLKNALYGVIGTIGAAGIWWGAINTVQPEVTPPPLPLEYVAVKSWVVTNVYQTSVTVSGVTYTVTIRPPFKTDLASLPPATEMPIGLTHDSPSIRRAGLIHDGLSAIMDADGNGGVGAHITNLIFYQAMLDDGTEPKKALACYKAVELWLFAVLARHTPESVSLARELVSVRAR